MAKRRVQTFAIVPAIDPFEDASRCFIPCGIYFEDFSQHLGPRIIGHFGSLLILGLCLASKLKSFLFILSKDNVPSAWGV
jgi:hypothetical protein